MLAPLRGEAALELCDHPVHCAEVLCGARGERPVELTQRLGRRQRLRALDQLPLELAPHVALELLKALAGNGLRILFRRGTLGPQPQRPADALYVHADHA